MKKGILLSVIILSFLLSTCLVHASELTDDYFDIATNYYNSNNMAKALEYLDLIITIAPQNNEAKSFRDKISPPPIDSEKTAEQTAKILDVTKAPENVIIVESPQPVEVKAAYDSDYYNTKGQEFYNNQNFNMAVEYFCKSISLNRRNAQAYNNLGMTYWCKNNPNEAIKCFKKANFINKHYTQPLVNASNVYRKLGNVKSQFAYLNKAIRLNPNDYMAYYWLGDYFRSEGVYKEAISDFKEVVKINPKYPKGYLSLSMCFFETEQFKYATMSLLQYLELCPDSDYAYYLLARSALAMCHYTDAKNYIEKAVAINDCSEYQTELAKINYYLQDYQAALNAFQIILNSSENAEIFNYVGLCNYKLKDIDVAIANFKKAIELDGLRPIYYYNLAQCYKSLGDKKNYVKYANTATKIAPVNYQGFIDLSYIYYDNGNPNYAINSLNEAIKSYPSVKSLYLAKLKIYESLGDDLHYNEIRDLIEEKFNK